MGTHMTAVVRTKKAVQKNEVVFTVRTCVCLLFCPSEGCTEGFSCHGAHIHPPSASRFLDSICHEPPARLVLSN